MRIGSVHIPSPLVLAPMAGVTDLAFRTICRELGAAYTITEMVSAKALCYQDKKTLPLMELGPEEHPGGVQIFGSDLACMEEGAAIIREVAHPDIIDINMGCPVPKVANNGDGSGLLRDLDKACRVAEAVIRGAQGTPVTVKMRLGWDKGNIVCLGERECSIQRNNQKLIEESPSPGVGPEIRRELMATAARAAKASGYVNAGTVEFLMDKDKNFYFMEMNTRLQVEHPVSELVTGIDIVKWQIRIAAGVPLDFTQEDIHVQGAAIECRINAKGPGKVGFFHTPGGPWVRFDTFLYQGYEIPPYYDSMLGKMIVYSSTREEAIRKMTAALSELVIGGTLNNIEDQIDIIRDERFKKGDYYTDFMKHFQRPGQ